MVNGTAPDKEEFVLPGCGFIAPVGKEFDCCAIGSTNGEKFKAGGNYAFTGNMTVYAVLKDCPYDIIPASLHRRAVTARVRQFPAYQRFLIALLFSCCHRVFRLTISRFNFKKKCRKRLQGAGELIPMERAN